MRYTGLHVDAKPLVFGCLMVGLGWTTVFSGDCWAIPKETSAEKAEHLKQQANPGLFNAWTFDKDQAGGIPKGFAVALVGPESAGSWKVEAQATAPSSPNALAGTSGCGSCVEILTAQGLQYEYPDLAVRIHVGSGQGRVGVVFGMKDTKNFYSTLVDLTQKTMEVIRVVEGKETVLGQAPIKMKPVEWHALRVQRNTIISKDFIECFFDGQLALSVEDQTLGVGQVGLVMRGETGVQFDNFNAAPLYSSRPVSPPAAY
ncbi:MAG: hypothetical protein KF814_15180 [Nitrospiraceae bacterium]|nr:hypothetical protein [Nitrospiraceae bacterium]